MKYKQANWPLDKIVPYENNPRTHPPEQITLLAKMLKRWGPDQPIVVDEDGIILKGHGRLLAATEAGFEVFPVVQRLDLPEKEKIAIRVADNQVALLSGWAPELIKGELTTLKLSGFDIPLLGFGSVQLHAFGFDVPETDMPELSAADRPSFQQMTFTLHDKQVDAVRAALDAAKKSGKFSGPNENSNGNALERICKAYSERKGASCRADSKSGGKRRGAAVALQRKVRPKQSVASRGISGGPT